MLQWIKSHKESVSIGMIWLVYVSGIFGIASEDYSNQFLEATPLNLLLSFFILIITISDFKRSDVFALAIPFILGFVAEALGVNLGWIFGDYTYGNNLGPKILGVPLTICFNWALLTAITANIAKRWSKLLLLSSVFGAALMTGLDVLIEVSAPRFDFWEFKGGEVPLQNYLGWFVTAFVAHLGYQSYEVSTNQKVSSHLFIAIACFFLIFTVL